MYLPTFNPAIYEIEPNNGEAIIHINFGDEPWTLTANFTNDRQNVKVDCDLRANLDVSNQQLETDNVKIKQLIPNNDKYQLKQQNLIATGKTIDLTNMVNTLVIAMLKYSGYHQLTK